MKYSTSKDYISITGLFAMALCVLVGCKEKKAQMHDDNILKVLRKTPIHFTNDGGGDSDLPQKIDVTTLVNQNKDKIIPMLIANLSNPTVTESTIDDKRGVSLGCVCFDFLCTICEKTEPWWLECGDDGFWACVPEEYHIPITINEENIAAAKEAQHHWQNLLNNNKLHFDTEYLKPKSEQQ